MNIAVKHTLKIVWVVAGVATWALAGGPLTTLMAHGRDARYLEPIDWPKGTFTRVFAASRSELGLNGSKAKMKRQTVDGRSCVVGSLIAFDVDDTQAFDIDQSVTLTVTYAPGLTTAPFAVAWDRNSGEGYGLTRDLPVQAVSAGETGPALKTVTLTLDRARFAGQGVQGADLAIAARNAGTLALCDVSLKMTAPAAAATPSAAPAAPGELVLEVEDAATHALVPARVGLYDATGRTPLPSGDAVPVHRFADDARLIWMNRRTAWPSSNRLAFYTSGRYKATMPAGGYDLVVARGPEYRIATQHVDVAPGTSRTVRVSLARYENLPQDGWYSGESHIHLLREQVPDLNILHLMQAEDIHLGNLLEMGNILGTYFKQSTWDRQGRFVQNDYALVSGQEDPRTGMRGHTIHWNLKEPSHLTPDTFFSYHTVFETTRKQGALTGYAHHGESFNGRRGLALDVPFGLVDFIEVLQGGRINTDVWYSFLNLGFHVRPVGGADWPYFGPTLPGIERTFVKVDGTFSPDAWYDGIRNGRIVVSNGPTLKLSVNGQEIGSEIRVPRGTKLSIVTSTALNPDIDPLDRLELVVGGEVSATEKAAGRDRVEIRKEIVATQSMWIAARAYGAHQEPQFTTIGHTAPIYVIVDGEPTWNRAKVKDLVAHQRAMLKELLTIPVDPLSDLEAWETGDTLVDQWPKQLPRLEPRIGQADQKYVELLTDFQRRTSASVGTAGRRR